MNSTLKVFGLLIVFFTLTLIGLLIGLNVHAQELSMEEATEVELIKLRASDIKYSEEKQIPILDGIDKIIGYNDVVDYSYLGNEVDANLAVFENNNRYTNIEKLSNNSFKIYSSPKYFKNDNGQVQEILDERVSKTIWDASTIKTTAEKIEALLKTPYVLADSYFPSSDGYVGNTNMSSWSAAYSSTPSGVNQDETCYTEAHQHETGYYSITRCYFIFDTSNIADDLNIGTSSLFLYGNSNVAGSEDYNIYTSSTTALTTGSFFQISNTPLSSNISGSSWNTSGFNEYVLNAVGTSTISKTGTTAFVQRQVDYDVNNTSPPDNAYRVITMKTSATAGSTYDPYLIVNTYTSEEEEENPTAVSNEVVPCTPMTNNDLSLISGCAVAVNGISTTTYSYVYHIPFIVWAVLFMIFNFIFGRLLLEFIIILRRK